MPPPGAPSEAAPAEGGPGAVRREPAGRLGLAGRCRPAVPVVGARSGGRPYAAPAASPAAGRAPPALQQAQPWGAPQAGPQPPGWPYGQPQGQVVVPKNPVLGLVPSLLLPGLGSMVNGEVGKGCIILGLYALGWILSIILIGIPLLIGAWIWGLVETAISPRSAGTGRTASSPRVPPRSITPFSDPPDC